MNIGESPPRRGARVNDVFDEEECRYQLQEIGSHIVPAFPFKIGMQHVYNALLQMYGDDHVADAISLLHELLDDESYEGRVWRSWRHDWRKRNDNPYNPWIPMANDEVLPRPTDKAIRSIKGENFFSAQRQDPSRPRRVLPAHNENRPSYISSHSLRDSSNHSTALAAEKYGQSQAWEPGQQPGQIGHFYSARDRSEVSAPGFARRSPIHRQRTPLVIRNEDFGRRPRMFRAHQRRVATSKEHGADRDPQLQFVQTSDNFDQHRGGDGGPARVELRADTPRGTPEPTEPERHQSNQGSLRPTFSIDVPEYEEDGFGPAVPSSPRSHKEEDRSRAAPLDPRRGNLNDYDSRQLLPDLAYSREAPRKSFSTAKLRAAERTSSVTHASSDRRPVHESHPGTLVGSLHGALPGSPHRLFHGTLDGALYENADGTFHGTFHGCIDGPLGESLRCSLRGSLYTSHDHNVENLGGSGRSTKAVRENPSVEMNALRLPTSPRAPISNAAEGETSQIQSHDCKPHEIIENVEYERETSGNYPRRFTNENVDEIRTAIVLPDRRTKWTKFIGRSRSLSKRVPKFPWKGHNARKVTPQRSMILQRPEDPQRTEIPQRSRTPQREEIPDRSEDSSPRHGALLGCTSPKHRWGANEERPKPDLGPSSPWYAYNFDGACDEYDSPSTADLNKALPPQPLSTAKKPSVSNHAAAPSTTCSRRSEALTSMASTTHSEISRLSSKKGSHRAARELVHPGITKVREPSFLQESDSDKLLVGSKFDPPTSPEVPNTPMTFSSFNNTNPFMYQYEHFIPPVPLPTTPTFALPDPCKAPQGNGIPQSRSESQIHSSKILQSRPGEWDSFPSVLSDPADRALAPSRGRGYSRDTHIPEASQDLAGAHENDEHDVPKRSRSPVRRLFRFAKSQSLKEIPQLKDAKDEVEKKAGLKLWGERLRHGFLTNTESKANLDSLSEESGKAQSVAAATKSTCPISMPVDRQAKTQCEMELMICITANNFLKGEAEAGHMSAESVARVMMQWSRMNRPQVVEFHFDQITQRELIVHNINTLRFHGEAATNPIVLNSTMYAWKTMAKEMSIRTFCVPDSVLRRHLHDAHRVLEMLGAGSTTFLALQELQVSALKEIADIQKAKKDTGGGSGAKRKEK